MSKLNLDSLLELLRVSLDAFAMCEVGNGCGLSFPAWDKIVVHYVLKGEGAIECERGIFPIREGMTAVIPKNFAKQLDGRGPVAAVVDGSDSCPLAPGIVRVRAGSTEGEGLVVACASVSVTVGDGLELFDHLQEPLVERSSDGALPLVFQMMFEELSRPSFGTKPMLETLMKQVFILLLRNHLKHVGFSSPLTLPLMNPQLGRALMAMIENPQGPHCVSGLAKLSGMSRSRSTHHFNATCGTSPMGYLHGLRLRAGARLLRSSNLPVKSVTAAVGFASRSHFSRAFRKRFGVDPTGFREADGAEDENGLLES